MLHVLSIIILLSFSLSLYLNTIWYRYSAVVFETLGETILTFLQNSTASVLTMTGFGLLYWTSYFRKFCSAISCKILFSNIICFPSENAIAPCYQKLLKDTKFKTAHALPLLLFRSNKKNCTLTYTSGSLIKIDAMIFYCIYRNYENGEYSYQNDLFVRTRIKQKQNVFIKDIYGTWNINIHKQQDMVV